MIKAKYLFIRIIIVNIFTIIPLSLINAQLLDPGVAYTYDMNGNRIKRRCTDVYMKRGIPNDSTEVEAALGADNKITVAPNPTTGI